MNEHLAEAVKQEDTVLFVGSGISCWSGLPSWSGLLSHLATYLDESARDGNIVRKEIANDLLQAASYGFDQLTPHEIGEFIRKHAQLGTAQPHEIHRKIVTLGARCFITTNYDHLIEDSLRRWQSTRCYRRVTNQQPFEEAEIIQTRALDFVFKPHGDAEDAKSVILTREAYRNLLEGGEWRHAYESLKTLLVTRRIVYLGFGLRDPDFLLLRDVLANTWRGGVRDHYAIIPDIGPTETSYWRKHYGIHLIGYTTQAKSADDPTGHSNLLLLLDELLRPTVSGTAFTPAATDRSQFVLNILRYADGVSRFDAVNPEFPLRVRSVPPLVRQSSNIFDHYNGRLVTEFLDEGPYRAALIGLPGAGKTYSIRRSVGRLAKRLYEACLAGQTLPKETTLPLFADLKLYAGDLEQLVELTLPSGLSLSELAKQFRVKIFLDSFNEMPREQWDRGAHEADFARFASKFPSVGLIVGSRTLDAMGGLALSAYRLDEIDGAFLRKELSRRNLSVGGRFEREVLSVLQKPFYFRLVTSGAVSLPPEPHPRDIYKSFFVKLSDSFKQKFNVAFDLELALRYAAYDAINRGEEAQPRQALTQALKRQIQASGLTVSVETIVNWLVGRNVLLPFSGMRVALFHQSVTEYLAANELADRYLKSPEILKEKLKLTRWDQALFLTLSLLPADAARAFLDDVIEIDFPLALNAAKYVETSRDELVAVLLRQITKRIGDDDETGWKIAFALQRNLPVTLVHESELRQILMLGGGIGAAAAARLIELKGPEVKVELLESLLDRRSDYNYGTAVGRELAPLMTDKDLVKITQMADSLEAEVAADWPEHSRTHGFLCGARELLHSCELAKVVKALSADVPASGNKARISLLAEVITHRKTTEALEVAAELVLEGHKEAIFPIHLIGHTQGPDSAVSWDVFTSAHIDKLVSFVTDEHKGRWALEALADVCRARNDLSAVLKSLASGKSPLVSALLLHAAEPDEVCAIFEALERLTQESNESRAAEPLHLLRSLKLDWAGREELFVQLLKVRDPLLAWYLLETQYPGKTTVGQIDIGPVEWWLAWLSEDQETKTWWWFQDRLSHLFSMALTVEAKDAFLAEFNQRDSKYRHTLAKTILLARDDLSTADFSDDAVAFLMSRLSEEEILGGLEESLLGRTATESFVTEKLLPLISTATGAFKQNLTYILRQAGKRHGRRYVSS